ncbi:hypothetical protein BpHYR1_050473 [Brachionus plicatilis]|uniref:Uncharacterized protein n=1 Tax=Brachionus plicatilis TaxID=10195 RepID=A0A3M7RPE3_BRAPC|nr:hypothetical protein BpHYR1_050473 [Brachionus plicatilis]
MLKEVKRDVSVTNMTSTSLALSSRSARLMLHLSEVALVWMHLSSEFTLCGKAVVEIRYGID